MKKRILSMLLACMLLACMLLNSLPVAAFAEEVQPECSHVCDESCGYVAPAAAVAYDKDCKPAEEGGEVTHVEGCAYKAAEEGSPCTHKHNGECGVECAHNYAEGICTVCGMAESKPVCNCGTDDASIHATTCAVYAAPEKPECHCVEKCLEANIWCDVCGIDYSLCGGTGKAEAYTDHKHCLSVHEDCTGHDDAVTWKAWEKTDSLPTSGNYYLTENVTLSAQHTVSGTLNLCLNGHTITPSQSGFCAIKITGNLSLTDCQGTGRITGFTNNAGQGGAVYVASGKQFTMYGGIISGNKVGAKYYTDSMGGGVYSEGTFTMHGGTISDNEAQRFGGGVYIASGKQFTMYGGTISGNKVTTTGNAQTYGGGGVYVAGDTFTMTGGTISGNEAGRCGGGVCIGNNTDNKTSGTFTMSDGTISGNKAMYGGGVYIDSKKQFTMSDGTISGNTSSSDGGGVRVNGTFTMSNGTISGNNAGYGGGVYISPTSASFTMTGGNITGNAATNNGGGVYMYEGAKAFELSGSPTISGNTGGNCYIDNHDNCFMTVTGALGENAKIGITTWSSMPSQPFCKPANSVDLSNYKNWFFSDRVDRAIAKNDDGSLYTTIVNTYALHFDSTQAKVTVRGIETTKAAAGNIVVISPIVPEGATVESVTATRCTVIKNEDGTYSFTMPANAVTITVTFKSPTVDVTGVTLVKDTLELAVGDSETLTAIVAPDNATNKNVSWTSSNTEVATVDETGKVTAVGAGTATITVKTKDGEFTDTCTVTVVEKYDLSVGGVQVTSDNKGDLVTAINQAANDTVATGSATYNPETCTLTLDNFSCSSDAFAGVIHVNSGDITIKLKGNNTLTGTGEYTAGISSNGNLVICNGEDGAAQGQLTINIEKENSCINAASGTLEITDVKVTATSTEKSGLAAESISLSGVTLSATGGWTPIYTGSVYLVDPETGELVTVYGAINIENSTVEAYCTDTVWGDYAFESAPNISGTFAVYAGEAKPGLYVDTPTAETYTTSKYVKIVPIQTYDVWVGGEQFTSKKLSIEGNSGTATYDPESKTLTLNNFSYTGAGYQTEYYSAAICAFDNLNIKLVGTNNITCQSNDTSVNCRAISVWYGKEFNTTGHLTITGTDKTSDKLICTANDSIVAVRSVTVDSATIQLNDGAIKSVVSDVTINNSVVAAAEVNGGYVTVENSKIETENVLAASDDLTITNSTVTGGGLAAWDDAAITTITASQINVTGISACGLYVENQSSVTAELVMGKAIFFENSTVRVTGAELLEKGKTYAIIVDGIGEGGVAISNSTVEAYGSEGACLRMQDSFTTFVPVAPVYFVGEQIVTDDGYMVTAGADKVSATEVADPTAETYASKYVRIVPAYTVTYMVGEDEVYTEKVEPGKDVVHVPEVHAKEGYTGKWDHDGKNITADTTINAVYTKNQPGTFTNITPTTNAGGGKITDEVHKLKEKIPFTQEEALQIEHGADVEVWLEVKDISASVPADDKKEIEKKLGDGDVAMYLDIVMFKQVGENEASRLTQLSDKVQITFQLPDSYINTDQNVTRTYSIIHVHDGEAEIITPVFDAATKTLTFETDRFSTYGVVYTDEKITPPAEETVPPTEKPTPPAEIPATGDSFQPAFWIACMTLSIFGIAVLLLDAKRRHAR